MTRRLCAAVVAVALLAGCGGGGEDEPAKIETKADFIAAADEVCRARDEASLRLTQPRGEKLTTAGLAEGLADVYAESIRKLEALDLPPGAARIGAQTYVQAVGNLGRPVEQMKATARSLAATSDVAQIKRLAGDLQLNINTVQAINDQADLHARAYGFKVCGKQRPSGLT